MLVAATPGSFALSRLLAARLHCARFARRCSMCALPDAAARKRKRMDVEIRDTVKLSAEEEKIFDRLLAVERHFGLGTQLRVAGGWVRDKLLGKDCYDIDIALDNMLGRDFCEKVNEYLKSIGEETKNVGVILSNPDQSKHLETARMKIEDVWVDFVNLRAETYADDSRIPSTMEFGTPKQDAERRDLTINSLFYNINTGHVEDHTDRGLRDLKVGVIATPLEPHVTFLDDPLRVLRSVRFASRFGFELEDDLRAAASTGEVRDALERKISRERIGHEVELMLLGNDPTQAMELLLDLKLFRSVFTPPAPLLVDGWERLCVQHIHAAWDVLQLVNVNLTAEHKLKFLLAALLFPLQDSTYEGKKRKKFPSTSFIIRESLKLKNADADGVVDLHRSARKFDRLEDVLLSDAAEAITTHAAADTREEVQRLEAGLELMEIKDLWRAALVLSSLNDLLENQAWDAQEKAKVCTSVMDFISKQGLDESWNTKPLLDGKEIMAEFQLKGGPAVKDLKDLSIQWQLAHPTGTAGECREWLKLEHAKGNK
ncbi:putative CCA tRNA nucleotidyltransferase 2 [Selaginella moellendorffii]|uniref:putative CCA tRNA nucleotidyltransferase 2 n=1 Tax=Selaginella moellendorffii TaxID=88036 RepID=UPI000D1C9651|nr:putative CCA tRNA nucleotidyltransferase 2 [Selaginella moellendorffii]|eukprot:XP_024541362.1 putative CCA tRNA nucleotidyltransferase 2 [Selaginella moellendorffii]